MLSEELSLPSPEPPKPEIPLQPVIVSVGEEEVVLTAFDLLAKVPGTRQEGPGKTVPKRPSSGPDTDPEDGDFFDY